MSIKSFTVVRSNLQLKNRKKLRNLLHSNSTFLSKSEILYSRNMALDFSRNFILAIFSENKVICAVAPNSLFWHPAGLWLDKLLR